MYLSDKDIKSKLEELNFLCADASECFNINEQIQPCSIDLRLDNVFWKFKKVKSIDFRKRKLMELEPRRFWKRIVIKKGESIDLKPGELILGRIYEVFSIPKDCAGKIEGRSSFSRMGLGVHINSDFINPDWRGHMPLQLTNYGKNPIRLYPFIPICQLMLIKLSSTPERFYGEQELQSKYKDDDGGPSYWWRDKRIKRLQEYFYEKDIALNTQEHILGQIGVQEPEIIVRFEKFVSKQKIESLTNPESLLLQFTIKEGKRKRMEKIFLRCIQAFFIIITGVSIRLYFDKPIQFWYWIVWTINLIFLAGFIVSFLYDEKEYLTTDKIASS
ncbi:dCTP deaminase [Winogradskyella damuponensis]|uniref:dCTP deaminase n=1 Tax=Winogradskyella damuponensis TaxID=943939 RepID=A0ABP8CP54_9FLAO